MDKPSTESLADTIAWQIAIADKLAVTPVSERSEVLRQIQELRFSQPLTE